MFINSEIALSMFIIGKLLWRQMFTATLDSAKSLCDTVGVYMNQENITLYLEL